MMAKQNEFSTGFIIDYAFIVLSVSSAFDPVVTTPVEGSRLCCKTLGWGTTVNKPRDRPIISSSEITNDHIFHLRTLQFSLLPLLLFNGIAKVYRQDYHCSRVKNHD